MKEIKFRAWDKLRHEYLSAGTVSIEIHRGKNPVITNKLDGIVDITNDSRFIFEQYIGCKDKNKNEIYEGDIVKFEGHIGIIKYYTGNVGGGRFRIEPNGDRNFYDEMGTCFSWNEIEIIGNIKQNPELIGV